MQRIYVFYKGDGSQMYLTAPNDDSAANMTVNELNPNEYSSLFKTRAFCLLTGTHIFGTFIPIAGDNLLSGKIPTRIEQWICNQGATHDYGEECDCPISNYYGPEEEPIYEEPEYDSAGYTEEDRKNDSDLNAFESQSPEC